MRLLGCLAIGALLGAGALRAQEQGTGAWRLTPLLRIEAGALNPAAPDAATLAFGVSAGLGTRNGTAILLRVLRQSQNRNSGADLTKNARDLVSLLLEHSWGFPRWRHQQYLMRVGGGVMLRSPWDAAAVLTAGLGVRYPASRHITLLGSFELNLADLPEGSYQTQAWDPNLLTVVETTVRIRARVQPNYGFLLAVEWHPGN